MTTTARAPGLTSIDWSKYPNFTADEFRCRCGCGRADMDPSFMELLQGIRTALDAPIRITSGFRCPAHNARVSSTGDNGPHTTGRAADIAVGADHRLQLLRSALLRGVQRVGVANGFIHLDTSDHPDHPRPRVWGY